MKRLSKLQQTVLIFYLILSGLVYLTFRMRILPRELINILIFFYGFGTAFGLLALYIRELRNNLNYLIWLGIGIIQFLVFYSCQDNMYFNMRNYSTQSDWVSFADRINSLSTSSLKATIFVLIGIKIFDLLSQKLTGKKLIGTYRRFTWYSIEDKRKISWLDIVFNLILYLITMTAVILRI